MQMVASPSVGVMTAATGLPLESTAKVLKMYWGESAAKQRGKAANRVAKAKKLVNAYFLLVFPKLFNSRITVPILSKRYL